MFYLNKGKGDLAKMAMNLCMLPIASLGLLFERRHRHIMLPVANPTTLGTLLR